MCCYSHQTQTSEGWDKLKQRTVPVPQPKPTEVLVKVHAVSLQYRDLLVGNGKYPFSKPPPELVPCSDMAGEVVAVGEDAQGLFKVGDRVVANFITTHLYGVMPKAGTWADAQGGDCQGVLEDYKTYKPEVCSCPNWNFGVEFDMNSVVAHTDP